MPHLSYGFIFRICEGAPGGANFVNARSLERPVRGAACPPHVERATLGKGASRTD